MRRMIRRPSPAMIVAVVALIAALGGTAIGASFITKKKAKNVANNQITKRAPGLSVASAKTADNLADQSQQIRAWARVNAGGGIVASKNVTSVVQDGDGRYCFDLPFTPNAAVATLDGAAANLNHTILTATDSAPCPAGNQDIRVSTGVPGGDSTVNEGFFIHIN
jgi:archaellin